MILRLNLDNTMDINDKFLNKKYTFYIKLHHFYKYILGVSMAWGIVGGSCVLSSHPLSIIYITYVDN